MKYKVLLMGNNRTIINEFFTYMDYDFECISTSQYYDDIMCHIKYVKPDVFVYCLLQEKFDDIKRFANVGKKISEYGIPLVIIGNEEDCSEFFKIAPLLNPLVLKKPITTQNITAAIIEMLKEKAQAETQNAGSNMTLEEETQNKLPDEAQGETKEKPQEETDIPPQEEQNRKKHILIVDDDSRILRMLKGYLSGRYELATAINGKIAMNFLETKKTDLVLLDYEMPAENGAAVLEKIRSDERTKNLPVVFLTGVTEKNKIREVLALKPQGYLLKPIDMEKLSSTIKGIFLE